MTIRNRILLFAILVTLVPSLGLGWVYFQQSEKTLLENAEQELKIAVSHVEREFSLWMKEQLYEIRVFSSSYLLSDELLEYYARLETEKDKPTDSTSNPVENMRSYLALVRGQYNLYQRLLVFNNKGQLITQDPTEDNPASLPYDWLDQLDTKQMLIGDFIGGNTAQDATLMLGVSVLSGEDKLLGILGVEIHPHALLEMMQSVLAKSEDNRANAVLSLVAADGQTLLSTASLDHSAVAGKQDLSSLLHAQGQLAIYARRDGETVVGMLAAVSDYSWFVLMEKQRNALFADIRQMRNLTLLVVLGLVTIIGLLAYWLARGIIEPLNKLTQAASQVADDNLDVQIPVQSEDELGLASQVFNDMVKQLKQSRERLELLSTIDSLTQLSNRKSIMDDFAAVLVRYQRHPRPFCLLLMDIDHFKKINDEYGHLAGDEVLRHVAALFREQVREIDIAGRYGGEEFFALLGETPQDLAMMVAERIRDAIASAHLDYKNTVLQATVSIGVAEISGVNETREQLIERADKAMYQAKQQGRNQVVLAAKPVN